MTGMDENEVAEAIMDMVMSSPPSIMVEQTELPEDIVGTGFYCVSGERRFRVVITACGEDV